MPLPSGFDIFLSYSRADEEVVEKLARALHDRGLRPFIDKWYLAIGESWQQDLERYLDSCRAVAVCLGGEGMSSWQQRESERALSRQMAEKDLGKRFPVIPVLLPGVVDPALGFLGLNMWVDLRSGLGDERALDVLIRAVEGEPPGPPGEAPADPRNAICPYRGLLPFREEDAGFFCGREAFTEKLVAAIAGKNLVAVMGASGSGKSSVVHAGLLPKLREGAGGKTWEILSITPGSQPLHALLATFSPPPHGLSRVQRFAAIEDDVEALTNRSLGLRPLVEDILSEQPGTDRLLLFVDQWEELYTQCESEPQRAHFLRLLLEASVSTPLTLVLTMRGDFYGRALADRAFADRLQDAIVNLGPMRDEELECAVVKPAQQLDLAFEDGLVPRILHEAGKEPGNLPLLEFLLQELWQGRDRDGKLTHNTYDSLGGVKGAIARRAQSELDELTAEERKTARRVLVRLVTPGEGLEDTRARATLPEEEAIRAVVRKFADARLVVTAHDHATGEDLVEVSHEALINEWTSLREWVEEDRDTLRIVQRIKADSEEWHSGQEDPSLLLPPGRRLEEARELLGGSGDVSIDDIRSYIEVSIAAEDVRREEAQRKENEARARRTLGRVSAGLGLVVLAAFVAGQIWLYRAELTFMHPVAAARSAVGIWSPIESEMILISADEDRPMLFHMGFAGDDMPHAEPVHQVRFAQPFGIGKHEVTFTEYDRFALATWRRLPSDEGWGRKMRPVINVSFEDAVAYAAWLAGKTDTPYRLPSEAEWEHAARAGTRTTFWWGDNIHHDGEVWANCFSCGSRWDNKQTAQVGSFSENAFGLKDTAGNVWEWVRDCWHDSYDGAPVDGSPWEEGMGGDCRHRVIRGGSWADEPGDLFLRSAFRYGVDPGTRDGNFGFRLARDL